VKILQRKAREKQIFSCDFKLPETLKYGRCEPSNMVTALGALTNGDIGLNAASLLSFSS